jgi:parallel beta-helix repeat protein
VITVANFKIPQDPAFLETLRKIQIDDSVHADTINPMFKTLLENTVHLKRNVESVKAGTSTNDNLETGDKTYAGAINEINTQIKTIKAEVDAKETPVEAQTKANKAESNAKSYTDSEIVKIDSKVAGKETPDGAKTKADTAEQNAKDYADLKKVSKTEFNQYKTNTTTQMDNLAKNKLEKTVFDLYKDEVTTLTNDLKNRITKSTRLIIGISTSGWTSSDCDYLCDGADDEIQINEAISNLPSNGGEIIILDGSYKIKSPIIVNKSNVKISGNGSSTKLIRSYNSSKDKQPLILLDNVENCIVSNLFLDGLKNTYTSNYNNSIIVYDGKNNIVENCVIQNSKYSAIYLYGAEKCIVRNNFIYNCDQNGILFNKLPFGHVAWFNILSDNILENVNLDGIDLNGEKNIIESNAFKNCGIGVYIGGDKNSVCNNLIIRGEGNVGDYSSSQHTIRISGGNNLVVSNYTFGKVIYNQGPSNTLENNKNI